MSKLVLAAALAFCIAGSAEAEVIDLSQPPAVVLRAVPAGAVSLRDVAVSAGRSIVAPGAFLSELPEPDVIVMMLLGLVLIGYRAGRDSSEKFK
ncbi:MAG: hypothetical protein ABIT83_25480 [Massilia sp.]